jgi:hypothetical protein
MWKLIFEFGLKGKFSMCMWEKCKNVGKEGGRFEKTYELYM